MNRSACPGPQTIPESAYAPLPLEPFNENVDSVSFVIMKVPLTAVFAVHSDYRNRVTRLAEVVHGGRNYNRCCVRSV